MRPIKTLGEIVKITKGKKVDFSDKGEKGYIDIGILRNNKIEQYTDDNGVECNENDILIAWDGSKSGTIGYGLTGIIGSTLAKLEITEKDVYTPYVGEFLKSKFDYLNTYTSGAAIPHIRKEVLIGIEIPLPPLETQKAIVTKLDQIFSELDQTKSEIQKNLDNTDELRKSALNQAFQEDLEMKKLGEVTEIQNGGTPKTEKKEYWDGDILWITPKDMGELNSKYVEDTSRKISKLGLNNSSAKLLPINSVILSSRAPIGYVAINTKPISTNQGCKGIIPNDNLKAEYLYYFLILSNKLLNSLGSGATFKELSSSKLGEVKLPVPPLSEQEKIVEHLDQVSKEVKALKSQYQSQLDNLEELKKSVLDKAFRGEMGE